MNILGLEIRRRKKQFLSTVSGYNSGWNWPILEPFSGAWQTNTFPPTPDTRPQSILAFSAVFACVTGISSDIAKLRIKLDRQTDGIWQEQTTNLPWLATLRKPNRYQTRIQFVEQWILSKLLHGNTYVLKERDGRGVVSNLYVLDPCRVTPLVAGDGSVYYQLGIDYLSGVDQSTILPASEIIHDLWNAFWHPLCGLPPLFACAVSASMGNSIQKDSTGFFANRSLPGGILTAPGQISDETAKRIKDAFETNFGGANVGRTAVLGDGLKFEAMRMTAENAQVAEHLKFSVEDISRAFHYPLWKLGGPLPPNTLNPQILSTWYYTDCLQGLIESLELSLDEGLELPNDLGTELDTDNLLRMDTLALYQANSDATKGGWMSPDEARFRANLPKVPGGNTPYLQQQNFSLEALSKRDARDNPFAIVETINKPGDSSTPPTPPPAPAKPAKEFPSDGDMEQFAVYELEDFLIPA